MEEIVVNRVLVKINQTIFISNQERKIIWVLVIVDCNGPLTSEEFESFLKVKVSASNPKKTWMDA